MEKFQESMYKLIVETSTKLPKDVRRAILAAKLKENAGTRAAMSLDTITDNILKADENVSPICQDTGLPTFKIKVPVGANQIKMKKQFAKRLQTQPKIRSCARTLLTLSQVITAGTTLVMVRLLLSLSNGKKTILMHD